MFFEFLALVSVLVNSVAIAFFIYGVIIWFIKVSGLAAHIEKTAAYECGFNPYHELYEKNRIRFYIIAILFIIFDLEIILLIPLVHYYPELFYGINDMVKMYYNVFEILVVFFVFVILGFSYEWMKTTIAWE